MATTLATTLATADKMHQGILSSAAHFLSTDFDDPVDPHPYTLKSDSCIFESTIPLHVYLSTACRFAPLLRGLGKGDVELLAVKIRLIVSRENPENSNLGHW